MKKKNKGHSFRNRLLATVVFVAVYPIILVVIVGILNYENVVKERFFESASGEMALVANYINRDVEDMNSFMIGILSDQSFYELINDQYSVRSELDWYQFDRETIGYLRSSIASKEDFDVVGLHLFGQDLYYWDAKRTGTVSGDDVPFEAMKAQLTGNNLRTVYYGESGIWLGRKILDKDTLQEQGIMLFRIDPQHLSSILGERDSEAITSNYLISRQGEIVANSGTGGHSEFIRAYELYNYQEGNYELTFGSDDYFVSVGEAQLLDLALIQLTTKEELLNDLQKVTDLIIILSIVNMPLYIFLGHMLYRNIMTPMEKLMKGMSSFESGNLDVRLDSRRKDEFGYMITTFNRMTESMKRLINEVYVEELARKDAEISALQEQINPHFLYNTLESINWRAQLSGQQEIAEMIQALSVIMDAGINRDKEKVIPLEREVFYMDKYMYLIQMRFGDKIKYETDFSEEVLKCHIPKMIVQPILENAVKHGIEPVGRGIVRFEGSLEEDVLTLKISDNGKGMNHSTKSIVRRIFQQEEHSNATKDRKKSIGLRNVARRLYLIYGDRASIDVQGNTGEGTVFTLQLPMSKEKSNES